MIRNFLLSLLFVSYASAVGTSTNEIWAPWVPTTFNSSAASSIICNYYIPPVGISSATTITFYVITAGSGSSLCGVAVYNETGATQIATTGSVACHTNTTPVTTTVSSFGLGTALRYLICYCSNASTQVAVADLPPFTPTGPAAPLGVAPTSVCDANATPPSSLGALSSANIIEPLIVLFGTATP